MSEVNEKVNQAEGTQETANTENNNGTIIEIQEGGKLKKVLKWVAGGLALVATGVAGILLGKSLGKDDDGDSDTDASEDKTEE